MKHRRFMTAGVVIAFLLSELIVGQLTLFLCRRWNADLVRRNKIVCPGPDCNTVCSDSSSFCDLPRWCSWANYSSPVSDPAGGGESLSLNPTPNVECIRHGLKRTKKLTSFQKDKIEMTRRAVEIFARTFDEMHVRWFPAFGTLLGDYRECEPMYSDHDFDLGVMAPDVIGRWDAIARRLVANGLNDIARTTPAWSTFYKIGGCRPHDGYYHEGAADGSMWEVTYLDRVRPMAPGEGDGDGEPIQMHIFLQPHLPYDMVDIWVFYETPRFFFNSMYTGAYYRYFHPFALVPYKWAGFDTLVPYPPWQHLAEAFGPGWIVRDAAKGNYGRRVLFEGKSMMSWSFPTLCEWQNVELGPPVLGPPDSDQIAAVRAAPSLGNPPTVPPGVNRCRERGGTQYRKYRVWGEDTPPDIVRGTERGCPAECASGIALPRVVVAQAGVAFCVFVFMLMRRQKRII